MSADESRLTASISPGGGGASLAGHIRVGAAAERSVGGTANPAAGETDAVWAESAPFAAALACLPGAGPATLAALLRDWTPREAWRRIQAGRVVRPGPRRPGAPQLELGLGNPDPVSMSRLAPRRVGEGGPAPDRMRDRSWQEAARHLDPPGWWARYAARGIGVTWVGHWAYPAALIEDPQPAGVLFWRGSLRHMRRPCVAIVGTRRATPDGRSVAFEMGRDLAAAGICVVSGLALGIDGAAHAGALSGLPDAGGTVPIGEAGDGALAPAPPAGVAASGVDVPYPRRHGRLWEQIAESGVILSETPPGRPAQAWRFPARNRIIAALSRMVVVVESHEAGGSLITAEAAILRGIDVRAVPGPVRSSASVGSNQLLHDGPGPVRNAQDVLDGLGIFLPSPRRPSTRALLAGSSDPAPDSETRVVLDAVLWRSSSLSQIVERSRVSVAVAARALDCLEAAGCVERHGDYWIRRAPGGRAP